MKRAEEDEGDGGDAGGGFAEDEFAEGFVEEGEEAVGVDEGDFEEEEILGEVFEAAVLGGGAASGEPVGVAEAFAEEQMGFVEGADEAEDVVELEGGFGEAGVEEGEGQVAGGSCGRRSG